MTTKLREQKRKHREFPAKKLKQHIDAIPFFILSGTKHPIEDYDTYALADSFYEDEEGRVFDEIHELVEYLSSDKYSGEKVMQAFYGGWDHFGDYELLQKLHPSEEIRKVRMMEKPSIIHALKCMLAGIDHANWFDDTRKAFTELLPGHDIELLSEVLAITSPMSHMPANLRFALQAYECIKKGRSVDKLKLIPNVKVMLKDLQRGTFEMNARESTRRKVINFKNAIVGEKSAVVLDSRMLRAYNLGREYSWNGQLYCRPPKKPVYDFIEHYVQTLGEGTGYEPRQITAMIWAGFRIIYSKIKEASVRDVLSKILCA